MVLKKIMLRYIFSIVYTLIFLVGSTYCWFNFREKIVYQEYKKEGLVVSEPIAFNSLQKMSDGKASQLAGYDFEISNVSEEKVDYKITIVPDIMEPSVSNNYVKYSINNSEPKSLNMNGVIYLSNLANDKSQNINLKIWISDSYTGNLNYNGHVVVS